MPLWHPAVVVGGSASVRSHARDAFGRLPPGVRRFVLHGLGRYAPWEERFDFTPPPLPPGEVSGPPDFVGIGAQKAGTTWWFELINHHPGISSPPELHKERHFFDRFGTAAFSSRDIDDYHGWFPRPRGTLTGEWTPDYFAHPWTPALLSRAAPEARLLLLVRDPVERFQSGLAHQRRMGGSTDATAAADAVQRGFYLRSLERWLEHFDADRLLVLQFEQCVADPAGQLDATFGFLGLSGPPPGGVPAAVPEPLRRREELDGEARKRLVALYEPEVAALAGRLPQLDLGRWPNFSYLSPNSPTLRP